MPNEAVPIIPEVFGKGDQIEMTDDPIEHFGLWFEAEVESSDVAVPSACCLSTIGVDGFPNARTVSLKEYGPEGFVITGSLSSRMGLEITTNPQAALTFWWPGPGRQIRIQGDAFGLSCTRSDELFSERPLTAQLLAHACVQGAPINDPREVELRLEQAFAEFDGVTVPRPPDWRAFTIVPIRMEFLEFSADRVHVRTHYQRNSWGWSRSFLQP